MNASSDNAKPYDLEERTALFAEESRAFVKRLPRTIGNVEDAKQFIRASGSIGANYIEANEALGKKDFVMKIKICRREAKETCYWLRLLDVDGKTRTPTPATLSRGKGTNEHLWRHSPKMRVTVPFRYLNFCCLFRISIFDIRISEQTRRYPPSPRYGAAGSAVATIE